MYRVWALAVHQKMADELPGHRPEDLLPGAQSLICFGIPIPRQIYQVPNHMPEMIWRSQNLLYRHLDTPSIRFAALLQENGERALPISGCFPKVVNNKGEVVG